MQRERENESERAKERERARERGRKMERASENERETEQERDECKETTSTLSKGQKQSPTLSIPQKLNARILDGDNWVGR